MNSSGQNMDWRNEPVFLRGLAILAVLFLHTTLHIYTLSRLAGAPILIVFASALSTGVPVFVFVSGFTLIMRRKDYESQWGRYFKKRFCAVVFPYVFFSLVYSAIRIGHGTFLSWRESALFCVENILTGGAAPHLWFIVNVLQLYILFPFFLKIYDKFEKKRAVVLFLVLAFLIHGGWITANYWSQVWWTRKTFTDITFSRLDQAMRWPFFNCLFFFAAGITAGAHSVHFKKFFRARWLILCLLFYFSAGLAITVLRVRQINVYGSYYRVPAEIAFPDKGLGFLLRCASIPLLCAVAFWLDRKQNSASRIVSAFGQYSFGIYLVHVLFDKPLLSALELIGAPIGNRFFYPLHFIGTAVLSYWLTRMLALLPWSEFLIGKTRGRGSQ